MKLTKKEKLFIEWIETPESHRTDEMWEVWDEYWHLTYFLKEEDFVNLTKNIYVKLKGKNIDPLDLPSFDKAMYVWND